jgi:hypothetical protein
VPSIIARSPQTFERRGFLPSRCRTETHASSKNAILHEKPSAQIRKHCTFIVRKWLSPWISACFFRSFSTTKKSDFVSSPCVHTQGHVNINANHVSKPAKLSWLRNANQVSKPAQACPCETPWHERIHCKQRYHRDARTSHYSHQLP